MTFTLTKVVIWHNIFPFNQAWFFWYFPQPWTKSASGNTHALAKWGQLMDRCVGMKSTKTLLLSTLSPWLGAEKVLIAMHLKQNGYCLGVLLIYTITTITLPSVGWCEPTSPSEPSSHLALHNERSSVLATRGLTRLSDRRGDRKRPQLDSRQGGESDILPRFHHFENREGTREKNPAGRLARTLGPKMVSSPSSSNSFKNREKLREGKGEWMFTLPNPPEHVCSEGKIKPVIHGEFYIPGELAANLPNVGYQSDSAVSGKLPANFPEFPLRLLLRVFWLSE